MNQDTECTICYDLPLSKNDILPCGHRVHISCVQKQFKAECPFCRTSLDIKVFGKKPGIQEEIKVNIIMVFPVNIIGDVVERNMSSGEEENPEENSEENSWKSKGYLYEEEGSDYDEENPQGDNWEYEDY